MPLLLCPPALSSGRKAHADWQTSLLCSPSPQGDGVGPGAASAFTLVAIKMFRFLGELWHDKGGKALPKPSGERGH